MATVDPLIDPAITGSELSSVANTPNPHNTREAAAAAAAAAVNALAASQFRSALGDGLGQAHATQDGSEHSRPGSQPSSSAASQTSHAHGHTPPPLRAKTGPADSDSDAAAAAPTAFVQQYNPAAHAHLALYLAALHGSRITADNLAGTFAPPLHHEKLLDWWKVRLTTSAVFLLLRPPQAAMHANGSSYGSNYQANYQAEPAGMDAGPPQYGAYALPPTKVSGQDLVGVIMLQSHPSETSPHVATIELLLVNLQYRELGGERQLLQTVEHQAVLEGRTLLTAETEENSSMAATYKDLGFTEAGRIPGMINRALTGEKRAQSIFYKDLSRIDI